MALLGSTITKRTTGVLQMTSLCSRRRRHTNPRRNNQTRLRLSLLQKWIRRSYTLTWTLKQRNNAKLIAAFKKKSMAPLRIIKKAGVVLIVLTKTDVIGHGMNNTLTPYIKTNQIISPNIGENQDVLHPQWVKSN